MPDIEETIFKLSIDGSAYVEGANKLSDSTKKLSAEQERNNEIAQKLKVANIQLAEETKALSAQYNKSAKDLRELVALQEKASGEVARKYAAAIKAAEESQRKLSAAIVENKELLKQSTTEIKNIEKANIDAAKATGGFTGGLKNVYGGLTKIANIIPGLGIASLVAIIAGPVIGAFKDWFDSITKTNDSLKILQKATEESFSGGGAAFVEATENVSELRLNVELAKQGFIDKEAVVNQYNTTMGKTAGTVKTLDEVEQKLVEHGDAYIQMMLLKAAAHFALESAAKAAFEAEEKSRKKAEEFLTTGEKAISFFGGLSSAPGTIPADIQQKQQAQAAAARKAAAEREKNAAIKESEDRKNNFAAIAKKFQEDAATIAKEHNFNFIPPPPPGKGETDKAIHQLQDDFEKRKAALLEEIAKLSAAELQTEINIRKQYDARLKKALLDLEKDKGLKKGEREELINLTVKLNTGELNRVLDDLHKKETDARKKLGDELIILQNKNIQDSLNLLEDEFDRRAKLIDFNEIKELDQAKDSTKKRLESLEFQKLLLGEQAYQEAKNEIISIGEQAGLNIVQKFANQRKDLAADIFQSLLKSYEDAISNADLIRDEDQAKALQDLKRRFLAQEITYKEFQIQIKKIKNQHDRDVKEGDLIVLKDQLAALDRQIAATEDKTTKHYATLLKKQKEFRKQIAAKESEIDIDVPPPPPIDKINQVREYAEAIGSVVDSVIQFWRAANEAESAALDRSIALQEKRVDAAQRIAERGNAQYLKAEEDRLKELQIKRENAARKQLGIDAALQASQVLVGITGAIAKIATPGVGIAETIGAIAIIVGALATGYGLVRSLQGNQPTFFVGTKDTGRGGALDNKGGFAATLHPNEAVIPADRNRAYKSTVDAIYDKTIPPEMLNRFVVNYHKIKSVPLPNYERIKDAAELHIGSDGRMSILLSEHTNLLRESNELQRAILRKKGVHAELNVDKNGVGMMVTEYLEQMERNKRI